MTVDRRLACAHSPTRRDGMSTLIILGNDYIRLMDLDRNWLMQANGCMAPHCVEGYSRPRPCADSIPVALVVLQYRPGQIDHSRQEQDYNPNDFSVCPVTRTEDNRPRTIRCRMSPFNIIPTPTPLKTIPLNETFLRTLLSCSRRDTTGIRTQVSAIPPRTTLTTAAMAIAHPCHQVTLLPRLDLHLRRLTLHTSSLD